MLQLKVTMGVLLRKLLTYWPLTMYLAASLFCLASVFISPLTFWPAVFTSFAIPAVWAMSVLLLCCFLVFRRKLMVFPLIVLILSLPYLAITYAHHDPTPREAHELSVLSFNAKLFRSQYIYHEFSQEAIDWSANDTSDVKCFQEYSTNGRWAGLDVTRRISDKGYHHYTFAADMPGIAHSPGLAIFSKYPILKSGIVWSNEGTVNAGIFSDILMGTDTVRIYNVHLESMDLKLRSLRSTDEYKSKLSRTLGNLRDGARSRATQVDKIIEHAAQCPYPYILCGDFNETPYSYNYMQLRRAFNNAFEEAGNGFGFTFNSVGLFFLRIDHQFYSPRVTPISFRVDKSIHTSDHFPTRGYYRLQ